VYAGLWAVGQGPFRRGQARPGDIDWNALFAKEGSRWFHTGGIYAAISETAPGVIIEAMKAAKANGTIVSYDLNYRSSLWKSFGGKARAQEVNREIARYVDVMIGNEEDFTAALGLEVEGVGENLTNLDPSKFKRMIEKAVKEYPNFKAVATTLREVRSATVNDWGAILYYDGGFYEAVKRVGLEIYDRVGGGDSFASGPCTVSSPENPRGLRQLRGAHGALAMTTPAIPPWRPRQRWKTS
jgi:2-dehydro-3-deoxygluconokinase